MKVTTFVSVASRQQLIEFSVKVAFPAQDADFRLWRLGQRAKNRELIWFGGNIMESPLYFICDKRGKDLCRTPDSQEPTRSFMFGEFLAEGYTPTTDLGFAWDDNTDGWDGWSMSMKRRCGSVLLALPRPDESYDLTCQPWSYYDGRKETSRWIDILESLGVEWSRLAEGTPPPALETADWLFYNNANLSPDPDE